MKGTNERDLVTAAGLLFEAANYLQRGVADDVELKTGLPGPWFETLLRLHRTPRHATRVTEMAAQVAFAPSSFSRLIDRMEQEGLVERIADPTNRRATLLQTTPAGEKRLAEAMEVHNPSLQARFTAHLTDSELDLLETITRKLREANQPQAPTRRQASSAVEAVRPGSSPR